MLATEHRMAEVIRATIVVVAVRSGTAIACAAAAHIRRRARIAVVARVGVVRVDATGARVAGIRRANVAVVAIKRSAAEAHAATADIVGRACIAVVARIGVADIRTTQRRMTRIVGAPVSIVAHQRGSRHADVVLACLFAIADVVVVTLGIHLAATRDRGARLTKTADANFSAVAKYTIGAGRVVRLLMIRTVTHAVARIRVITNRFARIATRRARRRIGEHATHNGVAGIDRALIAVIANERCTAMAHAAAARVVRRALAAVAARIGIVNPHATEVWMALVVRADVSVVTIRSGTAIARPAAARVARRARVTVTARY